MHNDTSNINAIIQITEMAIFTCGLGIFLSLIWGKIADPKGYYNKYIPWLIKGWIGLGIITVVGSFIYVLITV